MDHSQMGHHHHHGNMDHSQHMVGGHDRTAAGGSHGAEHMAANPMTMHEHAGPEMREGHGGG